MTFIFQYRVSGNTFDWFAVPRPMGSFWFRGSLPWYSFTLLPMISLTDYYTCAMVYREITANFGSRMNVDSGFAMPFQWLMRGRCISTSSSYALYGSADGADGGIAADTSNERMAGSPLWATSHLLAVCGASRQVTDEPRG